MRDIRRSQGRITGLPLAVFDGLFFPLLALDGLLAWLWIAGVRAVAQGAGESFTNAPWPVIATGGAVVICLLATFRISRRVWRAVRLGGEASPASGDWWWSTKSGGIALAVLCATVLGLVAYPTFGVKQPRTTTDAGRRARCADWPIRGEPPRTRRCRVAGHR